MKPFFCLLFSLLAIPVLAGPLTGRVSDATGRPLPRALVRVLDASGKTLSEALTQADGTFTINAVRPGRYTLNVAAAVRPPTEKPANAQNQMMAEAMAGMLGSGGTHNASQDVNVAGRDITDLTLVLRATHTISPPWDPCPITLDLIVLVVSPTDDEHTATEADLPELQQAGWDHDEYGPLHIYRRLVV